jgi:hypothetical protein
MSPAADSAGQPFEGRSFQPNSFQGDTGEADSVLEAALALFTEARAGTDPAAREEAFTAVVHALHSARLLVPLMTEAGDLRVLTAVRSHRCLALCRPWVCGIPKLVQFPWSLPGPRWPPLPKV